MRKYFQDQNKILSYEFWLNSYTTAAQKKPWICAGLSFKFCYTCWGCMNSILDLPTSLSLNWEWHCGHFAPPRNSSIIYYTYRIKMTLQKHHLQSHFEYQEKLFSTINFLPKPQLHSCNLISTYDKNDVMRCD